LREQRGDQQRRRIICSIWRRGHIPSPNENHLAPKKEGKGEDSLVPIAPHQHVCTSPDNVFREQRADQQRRQIICSPWRQRHIPSRNENHLAHNKEGKGEGSSVPREPNQHQCASPDNELRVQCAAQQRWRIISSVLRRGHFPSQHANHLAPKKGAKGECILVPGAPHQHLCRSPDNELHEQHGDLQRWPIINRIQRRVRIPSLNENDITPKKEGKGEDSLVPRALHQHLCTSPDIEMHEQRADELRRQIISNIWRRGHIPSRNESHLAPKKEGKGEVSLASRASHQHLCTSPDNELCAQRGD
jgi:hypothetical protein